MDDIEQAFAVIPSFHVEERIGPVSFRGRTDCRTLVTIRIADTPEGTPDRYGDDIFNEHGHLHSYNPTPTIKLALREIIPRALDSDEPS
jgi:hypothetical protein